MNARLIREVTDAVDAMIHSDADRSHTKLRLDTALLKFAEAIQASCCVGGQKDPASLNNPDPPVYAGKGSESTFPSEQPRGPYPSTGYPGPEPDPNEVAVVVRAAIGEPPLG